MIHNFLIGGVVISPLVPELAISVLLTALLSILLMRLGFYRLVWHRPLIEVTIFCIILGVLVAFTPDGSPLLGGTAGAETNPGIANPQTGNPQTGNPQTGNPGTGQ